MKEDTSNNAPAWDEPTRSRMQSMDSTQPTHPVVLVVDDEERILRVIQRLLRTEPIELLTVSNVDAAVEQLRKQQIAVVVSDQRMPERTGIELFEIVRKESPKTMRVLITGSADAESAISAINRGEVYRLIQKPWNNHDFIGVVRSAVEQFQLVDDQERFKKQIEIQNRQLQGLNQSLESRVVRRTREVEAQGIKIQQLYSELQSSFDATISSLLSIMELSNHLCVQHCKRTAARVHQVCMRLGVDSDTARTFERAALLHWLGLIHAPKALFRSTIDEFDAGLVASWEFHPILGSQALSSIPALRTESQIIEHYLRDFDTPPSGIHPDTVFGAQILRACSFFEHTRFVFGSGNSEDDGGPIVLKLMRQLVGKTFHPVVLTELDLAFAAAQAGDRTERERKVGELETGMTLSRAVETANGLPVSPGGVILSAETIRELNRHKASGQLEKVHVWE